MPAKAPIYLKAGSAGRGRRGRRLRLRDMLSPDLISPPLGDFRHAAHIGRGGEQDVFGDMSFLQGRYDLLPGGRPRTAHGEFLRANSAPSPALPDIAASPVLKNAISLPSIGGSQALSLPLLTSVPRFQGPPAPPKPPRLQEAGERRADGIAGAEGCSHPRVSPGGHSGRAVDCSRPVDGGDPSHSLSHSHNPPHSLPLPPTLTTPLSLGVSRTANPPDDSPLNLAAHFLSLQLDLGPSILEDVLHVMDRTPRLHVK